MKYFFLLFIFMSLFSQAGTALKIVCTTNDPAALANEIGGDLVQVDALALGSRDPHFAQAKPSMIHKVSQADLFILIGADLEIGWVPALLKASRNPEIVEGNDHYLDLSQSIELLDIPTGPVTRAMGDVHPLGNPHYWLDPRNGIVMAESIAARLEKLDPAHADVFKANLVAWRTGFLEKMKDWAKRMEPFRDVPVLAFHTSFRYLENAFSLKIVGFVEPKPGIAPGPKYLNQLQNQIQTEHLKFILMETYYPRKGPDYLARNTPVKVLVLPQSVGSTPETKTFSDIFEGIVQMIEAAK